MKVMTTGPGGLATVRRSRTRGRPPAPSAVPPRYSADNRRVAGFSARTERRSQGCTCLLLRGGLRQVAPARVGPSANPGPSCLSPIQEDYRRDLWVSRGPDRVGRLRPRAQPETRCLCSGISREPVGIPARCAVARQQERGRRRTSSKQDRRGLCTRSKGGMFSADCLRRTTDAVERSCGHHRS
jgi:hypothetical protein